MFEGLKGRLRRIFKSVPETPIGQLRFRRAPSRKSRSMPRAIDASRQFESFGDNVNVASRLTPARSWAYQLQHIRPEDVAASLADVVVIDSSPDGDWRAAFQGDVVARMKTRPGVQVADKKLICYMSIGEAEIQRFYWRGDWVRGGRKTASAPSWLHEQNDQGWVGNWKVRFWEPEWQNLICGADGCFLDRIIDQGFDGVYLDIIDAYDYWLSDERGRGKRPTAAGEMVSFVRKIAEHARVRRGKPEFAIIPQNGEGLLTFPAYRATISAIGKEDVLFEQVGKANQKPRVRARQNAGGEAGECVEDIVANLRHALADRIPILSVEYLADWPEDQPQIPGSVLRMRQLGFVPHIAKRDLGSLANAVIDVAGDVQIS